MVFASKISNDVCLSGLILDNKDLKKSNLFVKLFYCQRGFSDDGDLK